jgi:DNA-binding response OmpR family regulator
MNAAGKSILIIDPDTETSQQLTEVLSQEGYGVTSASSGREVLDDQYNFSVAGYE